MMGLLLHVACRYYRPSPLVTDRYRPLPTATDHYRPLPTATDRCRPLPTATDHYQPLPTVTQARIDAMLSLIYGSGGATASKIVASPEARRSLRSPKPFRKGSPRNSRDTTPI